MLKQHYGGKNTETQPPIKQQLHLDLYYLWWITNLDEKIFLCAQRREEHIHFPASCRGAGSGERETESRLIDLFFCRCKKTNQQNLTPKAGKFLVEDVKDTLKTLSPSPAPALSAQSINNTATFI